MPLDTKIKGHFFKQKSQAPPAFCLLFPIVFHFHEKFTHSLTQTAIV